MTWKLLAIWFALQLPVGFLVGSAIREMGK